MRIKLTQSHTHAGVLHPSGAALDLPEHDARWLIRHGIAEPEPDRGPAPAPKADPIRKAKTPSTAKE